MNNHCNLGVGCDEAGVCYAMAHGEPDRCGRPDERTPFDVIVGPRTVYGQIATGFVVGVRLPDLDVLVFGATVDETRRAAERLGGTLFGDEVIERRAMLVREAQSP